MIFVHHTASSGLVGPARSSASASSLLSGGAEQFRTSREDPQHHAELEKPLPECLGSPQRRSVHETARQSIRIQTHAVVAGRSIYPMRPPWTARPVPSLPQREKLSVAPGPGKYQTASGRFSAVLVRGPRLECRRTQHPPADWRQRSEWVCHSRFSRAGAET
jgi:hypothetical protein